MILLPNTLIFFFFVEKNVRNFWTAKASHIFSMKNTGKSDIYVLNFNKASQAIQSPRTVPFFLLVSLLDGYSFPNVLVKGIVAFKH